MAQVSCHWTIAPDGATVVHMPEKGLLIPMSVEATTRIWAASGIPPREFHTLAQDLARPRGNAEQAELSMREIASLAPVSGDMRYRTIST